MFKRRKSPLVPFLLRALAAAIGLLVVAALHIGVQATGYGPIILGALLLGVLNGFVKPVLVLLTLPLQVLTLGLFTVVINALLFWLALSVVPGLAVAGFVAALVGSLLVGFIAWGLARLFGAL
ncbi:MAG: phage holin family protein [Sulfobacillus sp.]